MLICEICMLEEEKGSLEAYEMHFCEVCNSDYHLECANRIRESEGDLKAGCPFCELLCIEKPILINYIQKKYNIDDISKEIREKFKDRKELLEFIK